MRVWEILRQKPVGTHTISPDHSVQDAVRTLVEHNIGALPVCDRYGNLVGIITERDVLRLAARDDWQEIAARKVSEVMTRDLVIGLPEDRVDDVMHVMTEKRIRHLPILDEHRLVGIISIGDVVKAQLDASSTEIRYLRDYMAS